MIEYLFYTWQRSTLFFAGVLFAAAVVIATCDGSLAYAQTIDTVGGHYGNPTYLVWDRERIGDLSPYKADEDALHECTEFRGPLIDGLIMYQVTRVVNAAHPNREATTGMILGVFVPPDTVYVLGQETDTYTPRHEFLHYLLWHNAGPGHRHGQPEVEMLFYGCGVGGSLAGQGLVP